MNAMFISPGAWKEQKIGIQILFGTYILLYFSGLMSALLSVNVSVHVLTSKCVKHYVIDKGNYYL